MATIISQPGSLAPTKFEQELTTMDLGIQQYIPAKSSLMIEGSSVKQPAIDAQIQSWLKTFQAVRTAKQAYEDAVKARLAITVDARQYYKALKVALKQFFGTRSAMLANFGITPDRPLTPASTKAKLQAAAKRQQTRQVRGTKSKKQAAQVTVVGSPPVSIASDGSLQLGAPPVNLPASGGTPTNDAPAAPPKGDATGSGGGNGTGSGTPSAG